MMLMPYSILFFAPTWATLQMENVVRQDLAITHMVVQVSHLGC